MKVVVTGGSGQLGTLVLERLATQRGIDGIVTLDLVPPLVPSPRIDWRICDLRDPGLERHLEGADAVVHLAFSVARRASARTMRDVNVEGSKRVFEGAARHGVKRVVYSSSVAAYGIVPGQPDPIVETTPRRRTHTLTYADNKYEVEAYLDDFEREHPDVAVVRLRPGILFGRRMAHTSPNLLRRRMLPIAGEGRAPIVWDEDVADAVVLALLGDRSGAYNLVASDPLPGEDLARLSGFRPLRIPAATLGIAVRASRTVEPLLGERRFDVGWIEGANVDLFVSSEKARAELGWKPRYPTSADVAIAFGKNVATRPSSAIRSFLHRIPGLVREGGLSGRFHEVGEGGVKVLVQATGRAGADFALVVAGGALTLAREIPRPPDATLTLSAETFGDLLAGKLEPVSAAAAGRIQVRGDPLATFVLAEAVSAVRAAARPPGMPGRIAERVSGWFGRAGGE